MSIAKNYLYNVIYQMTSMIIPLITMPYISRVLGSEGVGIYAFTDSIVKYFIFFAALGTDLYGNRAIAYVRENAKKRSILFWELFFVRISTSLISILAYYFFIKLHVNNYNLIFDIQFIYLFTVAVDISWFFIGMEEFKKIVLRNMFIKILGLISIFIFVNNKGDVWEYVLILSSSNFLGQLIMWAYIPQYIKSFDIQFSNIFKHFLPILKLFILQISIQIYLYLDKTMLGYLASESEVGIYQMAQKIVRMTLTLVTSLGIVLIPRISNLVAKNDNEKIKEYIAKSFQFANYLSIPFFFGILGIINEFVPWFFGYEFLKVINVVWAISPIIIIIPWGNVIGVQLMIPMGKELQVSIAPISGAIINIILNFILIPRYLSIGASVATVAAELSGTLITLWLMRNFLPFKDMFAEIWKYIISALIMFIIVKIIGFYLGISYFTTISQIIVGSMVYFGSLYLLNSRTNNFVYLKIRERLKF